MAHRRNCKFNKMNIGSPPPNFERASSRLILRKETDPTVITMKLFISTLLSLLFAAVSAEAQNLSGDSAVIAYLSEQGVPVTTNNMVTLLASGEEKFNDLLPLIASARDYIHLEYFNFRNDSIAGLLFEALAERAEHGVEVRALFDDFGNMSNNRPLREKHLKKIRESGIEIHAFDPILFPYLNHIFHRDHRKIIVIDGTIAYVGGINIADYYIRGLPSVGEWRDMHLRIEGDAVDHLQNIFASIWNKVSKRKIDGNKYLRKHGKTRDKTVAIVDREPHKLPKLLRETYIRSIASARKLIRIVNPYFIPTRKIRNELTKALERGVKVEIMISAKSDVKFTPDGVFHVAHKLMKLGADVYVYESGFHHSKVMTIDSLFCTVGSANLDSRSLYCDYEVNAFVFDEQITGDLAAIFERDKARSFMLTQETWKKRSKWRRFVGSIAYMLYPFL